MLSTPVVSDQLDGMWSMRIIIPTSKSEAEPSLRSIFVASERALTRSSQSSFIQDKLSLTITCKHFRTFSTERVVKCDRKANTSFFLLAWCISTLHMCLVLAVTELAAMVAVAVVVWSNAKSCILTVPCYNNIWHTAHWFSHGANAEIFLPLDRLVAPPFVERWRLWRANQSQN